MTKFRVGDRVAACDAYAQEVRITGTVTEILDKGRARVTLDSGNCLLAHEKALRRLKKREKKLYTYVKCPRADEGRGHYLSAGDARDDALNCPDCTEVLVLQLVRRIK
jgi:hypothetical protein